MILLSMTLPARVNRAANLVVASLNIPLMIFNAAGESWTYFSFYGLSIGLELLLLAFILRSAWTWPRTAPSATMATMATSPDREAVRAQQQA
jgi:NhaP-type Na+/H+ or K+/H+ antiporter